MHSFGFLIAPQNPTMCLHPGNEIAQESNANKQRSEDKIQDPSKSKRQVYQTKDKKYGQGLHIEK
jgi:hypothetical protein